MTLPKTPILVAEDDPAIRFVATQLLTHGGYEVTAVTNGLEAIDALRQRLPALIMSDIRMPGCTGLELLQHVRQTPAYTHLPFILVSARTEPTDIRMGMSLGADDYVTKPFDPDALLSTIAARLRRASAVAEAMKHHGEFLTRALPHELRTPLTVIIGYADLLAQAGERGHVPSAAELQDYGRKLALSGQRLFDAVEDFTLWGQIEAAAERHAFEPSTPPALFRSTPIALQEICATCAERFGRSHDLHVSLADVDVIVPLPGLGRIVGHVVRNAFKFSLPDTRVLVHTKLLGDDWQLEVLDRGAGMSAEQLAAFERLRHAPRQPVGQAGLGLGLSLVHRFVHLAHGSLDLRPRDGGGLHVIVRLPLSRPVLETATPFPIR